jgi:hypothetical protein
MSAELARESVDIRIPIFFCDEELLRFSFVGGAGEIHLGVDVFSEAVESL